MESALNDRSQTLVDEFFFKEDQKLIQRLRELKQLEETEATLAQVSGIKNGSVLKKLAQLHISPEILTALTMVPLLEVAWADGEIDEKERRAILDTAEKQGFTPASAQHALLEQWLQKRSEPRLMKAWMLYTHGLCEELSQAQINALKVEVLGKARQIAEASGGILGIGMKISAKEEQVLKKLDQAFKR